MDENIRVSGRVKAELEKRKGETRAESYNQVLERVLGIIPQPDETDKLVSDLHTGLQDTVIHIIETIRDVDGLEERVEEPDYFDLALVFTDKKSGYDLVKLQFDYSDNVVRYSYLNVKREWEDAATMNYNKRTDELRLGDTGTGTYDSVEISDVEATVKQSLDGSIQRWRD